MRSRFRDARDLIEECSTTRVRFYPLGDDEIAEYVATGEPMDKAGSVRDSGARGGAGRVDRRRLLHRHGLPACPLRSSVAPVGFCVTRGEEHSQRIGLFREPAIFTYRDERKLFALIAVIIVAATLALVQINAERAGTSKSAHDAATALASFARKRDSDRDRWRARRRRRTLPSLPSLAKDNAQLRSAKSHARRRQRAPARTRRPVCRRGQRSPRRRCLSDRHRSARRSAFRRRTIRAPSRSTVGATRAFTKTTA